MATITFQKSSQDKTLVTESLSMYLLVTYVIDVLYNWPLDDNGKLKKTDPNESVKITDFSKDEAIERIRKGLPKRGCVIDADASEIREALSHINMKLLFSENNKDDIITPRGWKGGDEHGNKRD